MSTKNAIYKMKIENEIVELMLKSKADNIFLVDGTTTLASKLAEMVTAINLRAKSEDVTSQINSAVNTAIGNLINDAPETYDTLKEIADYIASDKTAMDALNSAIGSKVDKVSGKGLSTNDFTTAFKTTLENLGTLAMKSTVTETDLDSSLKEKVNAAAEGNHSHSNKTVLDGITAAKVSAWDGKPEVYYSTSQPTNMKTNDIWIQPI